MATERRPAKQAISYEKLKEFGKTYLKMPVPNQYLNEDIVVVVQSHVSFLVAVAGCTTRLNPSSMSRMLKELYQMGADANSVGHIISRAFAHCILAGGKSKTGQKLAPEVMAVYNASLAGKGADSYVKRPSSDFGNSQECQSSPKRTKRMKKSLSSPSGIDALYARGSSSTHLKVITYSP